MRPELKKFDFLKIASHFFAMDFKGKITWDIDKEGLMLLAHQGGLTEITTKLEHFAKVLVREESITENVTAKDYTKDTTSNVPVHAYACVVTAHVVIGGVPGSRTLGLRSDTIRRKKPIGQDNLVSTADTSATKAAIKFALGLTKEDVQDIAKELKLDPNKTKISKVVIPEDAPGEDDEVANAVSEEDLKKMKVEEEALW